VKPIKEETSTAAVQNPPSKLGKKVVTCGDKEAMKRYVEELDKCRDR
jgi:hypothetical protein